MVAFGTWSKMFNLPNRNTVGPFSKKNPFFKQKMIFLWRYVMLINYNATGFLLNYYSKIFMFACKITMILPQLEEVIRFKMEDKHFIQAYIAHYIYNITLDFSCVQVYVLKFYIYPRIYFFSCFHSSIV